MIESWAEPTASLTQRFSEGAEVIHAALLRNYPELTLTKVISRRSSPQWERILAQLELPIDAPGSRGGTREERPFLNSVPSIPTKGAYNTRRQTQRRVRTEEIDMENTSIQEPKTTTVEKIVRIPVEAGTAVVQGAEIAGHDIAAGVIFGASEVVHAAKTVVGEIEAVGQQIAHDAQRATSPTTETRPSPIIPGTTPSGDLRTGPCSVGLSSLVWRSSCSSFSGS